MPARLAIRRVPGNASIQETYLGFSAALHCRRLLCLAFKIVTTRILKCSSLDVNIETVLLMSTCHQSAQSFGVLGLHPLLNFLLDCKSYSIISIRIVRFISIRFHCDHFITLCVPVIVATLLPMPENYIGSMICSTGKAERKQLISPLV